MFQCLKALHLFLMLLVFKTALATEAPIHLKTTTGMLEGTLRLPDSAGQHPVVLIVPGSGPTDRNGNSGPAWGGSDCYHLLADALLRDGFASVVFDKRGVGASASAAPPEYLLDFDTLVDDVIAWVDLLARDRRFSDVVVMGHSEGALMAMISAERRPHAVAAVVSLASPAQGAGELLKTQARKNLPADLFTDAMRILNKLAEGKMTAEVPVRLEPLYRLSVQPYLLSWMKYQPEQEIRRVTQPVLIVQGISDIQVDPDEAGRLQAAQPHARLVLIPAMNHVLKIVPHGVTDQFDAYTNPNVPLHPMLEPCLRAFLRHPFDEQGGITANSTIN